VVTPTFSLHSYRFLASTGYNSNAGGCLHPYDSGEQEIGLEVIIEEQRRLARSPNLIERVLGSLCIGAILKERLVGSPNSTIGQLLTDHIWSHLNLLGPESVIVEIASKRLDEKYGASLVCPECGAQL
jgi:hypothetical protein